MIAMETLDVVDTNLAVRRLAALQELLATIKREQLDRHGDGYAAAIGPSYNTFRRQLRAEVVFQHGKVDRLKGLPARSANGMYLNGWYFHQFLNSPHSLYCITSDEMDGAMKYVRSMELPPKE